MHELLHQWMPHGQCFAWEPWVLWPLVAGQGMAFLAYLAFAVAWARIARERQEIPSGWVLGGIALFFLLCGAEHALKATNVWRGYYQVEAWVAAANGVVSLLVAAVVWARVLPFIMSLPRLSEVEAAARKIAFVEIHGAALQAQQRQIQQMRSEVERLRRERE